VLLYLFIYFLENGKYFIQLIKLTVNTFRNLQKIILSKLYYFESVHQNTENNVSLFPQKY